MAKPLKTAGLAELTAFRRRAKRQLSMERVDPEPIKQIMWHLDQIEYIMQTMREEGDDGD